MLSTTSIFLAGAASAVVACSKDDATNDNVGGAPNLGGLGGELSHSGSEHLDGSGGEDPSMSDGSGGEAELATGGTMTVLPPRDDTVTGPSGRPFEPEGLELNYVGMSDGGLEIVAYTLDPAAGILDEPTFFVAMRNSGLDTLCDIRLYPELFDAEGTSLGDGSGIGPMSAHVHVAYGEYRPCLGVGEVGMDKIEFDFAVETVTRIDYQISASIIPSAKKVEEGPAISEFATMEVYGDSVAFSGVFTNTLSETVQSPVVDIFLVDSRGRPYGFVGAIDLIDVPPEASWTFSTTSFEGEVENFVMFVDYHEPYEF